MRRIAPMNWIPAALFIVVAGALIQAPAHAGLTDSIRKATHKAREQVQSGKNTADNAANKVDNATAKTDTAQEKLKRLGNTAGAESALVAQLGLTDTMSSETPEQGSAGQAPTGGGQTTGGSRVPGKPRPGVRGSSIGASAEGASGAAAGAAKGSANGGGGRGGARGGRGANSGGSTGGVPGNGGTGGGTSVAGGSGGTANAPANNRGQYLRIILMSPVAEPISAGKSVQWHLGLAMLDVKSMKWVAPASGTSYHGAATVFYGMSSNQSLTLEHQELGDVTFSGSVTSFSTPGMSGQCIQGSSLSFNLPECAIGGVKLEVKPVAKQAGPRLAFVTQSRLEKSAKCKS